MASALNARGVRSARGGTWHPDTVRNLVARVIQECPVRAGKRKWATLFGTSESCQ